MTQLNFDLTPNLPIAGKAPRQRHASYTGAVRAASDRPMLASAYLQLLRVSGPMSDHAAAKALGREVSSINSTRNGLGVLVQDSGTYEDTPFGTRRTRWMVAK